MAKTIYAALVDKLGRIPTNAELRAEVNRIKQEGYIMAASKGKLPHQRKRKNPVKILATTDHDWIPVHAIRKTPEGNIEIMTERGTLSNPGKKKKVLAKIKKMFSK